MITSLEPPAERDLPPARAATIRATLLSQTDSPTPDHRAGKLAPGRRSGRVRLALLAAVSLAAAGAVAAPLLGDDPAPATTLAMGPSELTSSLAETASDCLAGYPDDPMFAHMPRFPVAAGDLAVAAEHSGRAMAIYLADDGFLSCHTVREGDNEESGGFSIDEWHDRKDWLPGPVQLIDYGSSGHESGWVFAAGRVSARVDRLVLEHGNGASTEARLSQGAFGLVTTTEDVGPEAKLVAYDAAGEVVERDRFFAPLSMRDQCYAAPDGTVIYPAETGKEGAPGETDCLAAEPWVR
ncbi:hypothetical protein FB565_003849 [Actinoplanes lutulentus]|uniref:Uncharacterized protein n=1 Tax=Actinoplanes lutulentus TaxID=1287878 RepID=A0A327ZI70_9ACTN|nr:hypothetical protein [Actinoplanes lutulentus]MBB2944120.1 hypothetical protein [Actinoplanes lutulentus]RAK42647.1 hypothetical protein B0I29_102472 [Actinoplanes lutulentus]